MMVVDEVLIVEYEVEMFRYVEEYLLRSFETRAERVRIPSWVGLKC